MTEGTATGGTLKDPASALGRQIALALSALVGVVGVLFGTGALGTRVEESAGGRLSAEATLIAPAGPAFSIWSLIYAGLIGFVIWHGFPSVAARPRVRSVVWPAAASLLLNAAWLLVTQVGWLEVSVLVIAALVAVLGVLMARLNRSAPEDRVEAVLLDGTFGLYLGWTCVATCANIAATLVGRGAPDSGSVAQAATVVVLVVVVALGWFLALRLGGRYAVAAAMAWGLAWVAVGRLALEPRSLLIGLVAAVAAVLVLAAAVVIRSQRRDETAPMLGS